MILLIGFVMAIECQDETDIDNIPCDMITPIIQCANLTYNVTNTATGLLAQNGTLTPIGDGTYKFVFTQGIGNYNVFLCEGSLPSGTLSVGSFKTIVTAQNWGIFFILILAWSGLVIGISIHDPPTQNFFVVISSILLVITGIHMFRNGFFNLSGFIIEWFPLIQILIGLFIFLYWTWKQYEND